eukprot:43424_1
MASALVSTTSIVTMTDTEPQVEDLNEMIIDTMQDVRNSLKTPFSEEFLKREENKNDPVLQLIHGMFRESNDLLASHTRKLQSIIDNPLALDNHDFNDQSTRKKGKANPKDDALWEVEDLTMKLTTLTEELQTQREQIEDYC